jgi:hypothetical protein
MWNFHAAQNQFAPGCEPMRIVTVADPDHAGNAE